MAHRNILTNVQSRLRLHGLASDRDVIAEHPAKPLPRVNVYTVLVRVWVAMSATLPSRTPETGQSSHTGFPRECSRELCDSPLTG